jgi:glycosyltransferase involved in cell wall biosynthesis
MRILHLVWIPRLSGAEVLVKDLAMHQQAQGHTVSVASLYPEQEDFAPLRSMLKRNGVPCFFPATRQNTFAKLWRLLRVIRGLRPDIVFAHATIPAFYARALPISVPIVYVMHSGPNDFRRPLFRRVERVLSRRARALVGVSEGIVADYRASVGQHPLMTVIPNGVDMTRFAALGRSIHSAHAQTIVQIGRYLAVKDQMQTVRAFSEVLKTRPDARLVLCGLVEDRDYHAGVIALAAELGVANRVSIEGPRTDVPDVLAGSQVFAMPSRSEGHSVAFLEALASGIPVVASNIAAFSFAQRMPAVQLIDPADTRAYAEALVTALDQQHVKRELPGLTLADTADQYNLIARQVLGAT